MRPGQRGRRRGSHAAPRRARTGGPSSAREDRQGQHLPEKGSAPGRFWKRPQWNRRLEAARPHRGEGRRPRRLPRTGAAQGQGRRAHSEGLGRQVAHVPSLWGHYRTLSPQFHPPEKAALRCTEMAEDEEAQQEPPAAARAGVWGPQCPGACSADSPSGFCHQSHQSRREPAQPTRTPADPSDFRPADLSNFSPKEAAGDQQVRKTCSRSGECKAQPQRAVTSTRHHGPHRRDRRSRCSRRLFQRRRGNAKRTGGGGGVTSAPLLTSGTSQPPARLRD